MTRAGLTDFIRNDRGAMLVVLVAIAVVLCLVGIYVVGKIRSKLRETDPTTSDFITNFRELHSQGELSDEEYRTIKATLATRLQQQVHEQAKEKDGEA
jgi:uncharacterized membrane protein